MGRNVMTEFAKTSTNLTQTYAPSTHTAVSMGSFLNGRYPANLNWRLWMWHKREGFWAEIWKFL